MKERDQAVVARQETAQKTLAFGVEAFKNVVAQVIALNPRLSLETTEVNIAYNVLGGVLMEYSAEKTCHEARVIPKIIGDPDRGLVLPVLYFIYLREPTFKILIGPLRLYFCEHLTSG